MLQIDDFIVTFSYVYMCALVTLILFYYPFALLYFFLKIFPPVIKDKKQTKKTPNMCCRG